MGAGVVAKKGAKNTWSANCHLLTPDMLPPVDPLPRPQKQQGLDMEVTTETQHGLTRNWKKSGMATNECFLKLFFTATTGLLESSDAKVDSTLQALASIADEMFCGF